jgi:hypothetical protein
MRRGRTRNRPPFNSDKSHDEQNRKFKSGLDRAPLVANLTVRTDKLYWFNHDRSKKQ